MASTNLETVMRERGLVAVVVFFLTIISSAAYGAGDLPKEKYDAASIPEVLRKDARAVIRHDNLLFEVRSIRDATLRIHRVITILEAEGRDFGEVTMYYDKFVRIDDFEMRVLDASGEEVRSLSRTDVNDYAATPSYSLYEDNRVRYAKMYHSSYPYTIEYEIAYDYNGYIGWPAWYPEERNASVEYAEFRVSVPKELGLRYWKNSQRDPTVTEDGGAKEYLWTATMLRPVETEPVGPSSTDQYECVRIAPAEFEIDGFKGDMSSWKSFGLWYHNLASGRQVLPEQERTELQRLIADAANPKEKIRLLYDRLQSKTRYVSIQLGIGGWQPFDATYVCQRGYGDCKALTNYMVAMLGFAGVTAYPALIYSDTPPPRLSPEFPSSRFNHVIACVPMVAETVWLECTSQTIPMGHVSRYNENRYALVVTPEGGVLVKTPSSRSADNMQVRRAAVSLFSGGNGTAQIQTTFTGDQQDFVRNALTLATPKEREEWLREHIEIPVFNVQQMDFSQVKTKETRVGFTVKLQLPRLATLAGTRLLFQPNLMEKRTYVPPPIEKRKHPIMHSYPYLDIDTITYLLPEGFTIEAIPKAVKIETSFARFQSAVEQQGVDKLIYTRRLELTSTELPPEKYHEFRKFFQDVVLADKASAAIVKK